MLLKNFFLIKKKFKTKIGIKKTEIKKIISSNDKLDFNANIGKNAIKQKILVFFKFINNSRFI
jgi:hypothetical protein